MTKEELEEEVRFRLCKGVFAALYREKQISYEQLQALLYAAAEKLEASIGKLEVNSIAGEKSYTGWFPEREKGSPDQSVRRVVTYARISTMKDAQENCLQSQQE